MKYVVLFLLMLPVVSANIVINEVYYDPINSETGGEAIELYNDGNTSVDITGLIVKTKSSSQDAVIPSATISANGYYLIADLGWDESKDDESWPSADYEEAITLSNSDSGVAIILNGTILDAVGWGDENNIPQELFEVTPTDIVSEGYSLQRIEDTNNNIEDFENGIPNFQSSKKTTSKNNEINFMINIINPYPKIINFTIEDDDNLTESVQVLPNPNSKRSVNIEAEISDADIAWVIVETKRYNLSFDETWKGSFEMDFYDEAKEYDLQLYASNNYTINESYYFEYLPLTAILIDGDNLEKDILQGENTFIYGDDDMTTPNNITIKNIGNTEVDFMLSSSNITSEDNNFPLNNVKYSFDLVEWKNLSVNPQVSYEKLGYGINSLIPLSFSFEAGNIQEGSYSGKLTITALEG